MGTNDVSDARRALRVSGPEIPRVLDSLRRIVRLLRVASRATEKEIGISGAQLYVLQELAEEPASSVNELAERTTTHQSSVSAVVSRLVERGLVARRPSPEDGRRVNIEVTAAGLEMVSQAPPTAQVQLVEGLRSLTDEQREMLADLMERWVAGSHLEMGPVPFIFEEDIPPETPETPDA
ncbi:MAG: MarR family transcriptional regulator [Gemmatimonadetes bacterium]|nr:MarR family transcriptional regulator [Gemmatimonadota bacterium]